MKLFIDCRVKDIYRKYLESLGFEVILIKPNACVYDEISSHADIYMCNINGKLIVSENIKADLSNTKYIIGESVENSYPKTAKYNICVSNSVVICNTKNLAKKVKDEIYNQNLKIINVNQGYTRCSTIPLRDNSYITSDIGIKKVLDENKIDALYLENEDIKLLNKNGKYSKMHGFIGGATCVIENKFILFGDSRKLKNRDILIKYLNEKGYEFVDFKDEDIIDYGGVVIY